MNIQGRVFEPVGYCIFCGSDGHGRGLRDEHIIPYSLGGKSILPKASCANCEKITSYVDGYLARHIFYDYRLSVGTQSRTRKRDRPKTRPAIIQQNSVERVQEFEVGKHPFFTLLPLLGMPGILVGEPPQPGFRSGRLASFYYWPPGFAKAAGAEVGESIKIVARGDLNLTTFARGIAKVGYCNAFAAGEVRVGEVLPVANFILGLNDLGSYLVGSDDDADPSPPDEPTLLHRVTLRWEHLQGRDVLFAVIRLFAHSGTEVDGMPTFLVAISEKPTRQVYEVGTGSTFPVNPSPGRL